MDRADEAYQYALQVDKRVDKLDVRVQTNEMRLDDHERRISDMEKCMKEIRDTLMWIPKALKGLTAIASFTAVLLTIISAIKGVIF